MDDKIVKPDPAHAHAHYIATDGAFIPGVPARDLTKDEWLALDKATRDLCRATGVYELTPQKDTAHG